MWLMPASKIENYKVEQQGAAEVNFELSNLSLVITF